MARKIAYPRVIPQSDGAGTIATGKGAVWVANLHEGTVSRIDPVTATATRTMRVGNRPQGLALAAGLVWVGSQPAPTRHRGGTLTILTQVWADNLDPVLTQITSGALEMTYDGLTAYQRVGGSGSVQVVPDLAVSLPAATDAGTTYTFQLRRGIRYSNGELVRPEDFRRALERDLRPHRCQRPGHRWRLAARPERRLAGSQSRACPHHQIDLRPGWGRQPGHLGTELERRQVRRCADLDQQE